MKKTGHERQARYAGRKAVWIMAALSILISTAGAAPATTAGASSKYITAEEFAEALAAELDIPPVSGAEASGYVNALVEKGIIKSGDFSDDKGFLTRGDALVFLNRADEYLNGDTVKEDIVQLVIGERISDINKVKAEKRPEVAKAFFKGYMKGYSNGDWSTDRSLKVTSKITKAGALNTIRMLRNPSLRAKISPDGQLIRTTNPPYSYKKFPYILASYPNEYYDWMMRFDLNPTYTSHGIRYNNINLVDYAAPVDIDKLAPPEDMTQYDMAEIKEKHLASWVDKVQSYLELVFSANYKTIDEEWVEAVLKTDYSYGQRIEDETRDRLKDYVTKMKANKTIVEYERINVDPSSLYYYNYDFYLRANVKYRVVSSNVVKVDTDTQIREMPYKNILWTRDVNVDFVDLTLGDWRECGFDISIAGYSTDLNDMGIFMALLNEYRCKQYLVTE